MISGAVGNPSFGAVSPWRGLSVLLTCLALGSCSGGSGSGSGGFDSAATLLSVRFPDPTGVSALPDTEPPADASLIQQVVLEFSARPDPDQVSRLSVQIRGEQGTPVEGRFDVEGRLVTFTPTLPLREARALLNGAWDNGGAGLQPESRYTIRVGSATWPFVVGVAPELAAHEDPSDPHGVAMVFETTKKLDRFFRGLPRRQPRLVRTEPADGATDVSPQLYTDPDGLFPPRAPFLLHYDAPVFPGESNLDFLIVDLDDPDHPSGLTLATDVSVLENELEGAVVRVMPSGILPFGHLLTLEAPAPFVSVAGQPPQGDVDHTVVASFTTSTAPDTVRDRLEEFFTSKDRQDDDSGLLSLGELPAEWDRLESKVLQASFAFDGGGELGRFIPSPPPKGETKTIILDTSVQVFPLFDGSTPDVPPGFEVLGGVFNFTEIVIPKNVILEIRGNQPLIFTSTTKVEINGQVLLDGQRGTSENSHDSAVFSVPGGKGGPGGGRGGEAHPVIYWPPDQVSLIALVSPPRGGRGFGPGDVERSGGEGGESGIRDDPDHKQYYTDQQITCQEAGSGGNDNRDRAAGGSGGSFLTKGGVGRHGNGNVRPDSQGGWLLTPKKDDRDNWDTLYPGQPGWSPFNDPNFHNDFIGVNGEVKELIGGQGGGAGGSRSEAFYCGVWCKNDSDSDNDNVCKGGEWGNPPRFADSVGDARGGSAGGGGGAIMIQALGPITLKQNSSISARGLGGGGGETTGRSNWGGPAAGGSGGAILLQSAESVYVKQGASLDVSATGGVRGGAGIVQLQVPIGNVAEVEDSGSIQPQSSWVDPDNTLNPARFTAFSAGISTWYDLGRTIDRPPADTNPIYQFHGLDESGFVRTDGDGNVLDPQLVDVRCDYLGQLDPLRPGEYIDGQEPRAHFIPTNATVQVLFQGARAVAEGSKEVDVSTITDWTPDPADLSSMQFLRYRVTFDIAADKSKLRPDAPRPAVQSLRVRARF